MGLLLRSDVDSAPRAARCRDPGALRLRGLPDPGRTGFAVLSGGAGIVSSGTRATWIPSRPPLHDPIEDLAFRLDAAAVRFSRGRGAVDLAIGEMLDRLFTGGGLQDLGWSRQIDFARERLGVPARTMYSYLELARQVADLPELRRAVIRGEIPARKARAIAPALSREPERSGFLLLVAKTKTLPEIRQILKDLGEEVPRDRFEVRARRFRMAVEMQQHLDRAIDLAKFVTGHGRPRWVYLESIAMEYLAAHADLVPEPRDEPEPKPPPHCSPPSPEERRRLLARWESRDTAGIEAALDFLLTHQPDAPGNAKGEDLDPAELEAALLRLLSFRSRWDEPFGRILETIATLRLFTFVGYSSFARYATERLGISERNARQRVWLEKKMAKLPALRMALRSGRLPLSKALLVAADATRENVGRRIREAAATSWKQLRRESTKREDRQNLAAGIRRIWGPLDPMETIEAAIAVARKVVYRETGLRIGTGEALGLLAAHFEDEWSDPVRRNRLPPLKRKVFARTSGICAMPTCSNPADHMHHIIYRSRQGPDEEWNCCYLCTRCHRRLHRGKIRIEGRAGEHLQWRIWRGGRRWEVWETVGSDDVRKLGEIAPVPGC